MKQFTVEMNSWRESIESQLAQHARVLSTVQSSPNNQDHSQLITSMQHRQEASDEALRAVALASSKLQHEAETSDEALGAVDARLAKLEKHLPLLMVEQD